MKEFMLTTIDNPFSPFTEFDDWYLYDEGHGYHTCSYLARVSYLSDEMPDSVYNEELERAIDEICQLNLLGLYKKVSKDDYKNGKWKPRAVKIEEKLEKSPEISEK